MTQQFDVIIVGGGIVGAATAWQLSKQSKKLNILLLEKEASPACHQTGRNSGVIHAGVYYPPNSLKARFCKDGLIQTYQFCRDFNVPYEQCGKLVVATNEVEQSRLEQLMQRCDANELVPERLSRKQLKLRVPGLAGEEAIWIKQTGITDYRRITQTMLELAQEKRTTVIFQQEVHSITESSQGVVVDTLAQRFHTKKLLVCGGLESDRLIKSAGFTAGFKIIPFKGEYFRLPDHYSQKVPHLIYPVPDPDLPFLGIHLTRMIDGGITVGPNAVLAMKREGYNRYQLSISDLADMVSYKGFWKLLANYAGAGVTELKNSFWRKGYLAQVQKYWPRVTLEDLKSYPCGIRAQAVDRNGQLIHDFKFVQTDNMLFVGNAPSPAATSAIPIAQHIIKQFNQQ
ncbi:L-2-hydroxyglutarate oxidase [Neptunicella marina]|uniref:L-2-hydroxyglutarate oxidase n=1 Tax=Neptunicella marina TaxID=2125989 RepID=A0A8J6IRF3_9ALTE|nr:L-2-hydroxyglutarate oxidase [Neptunicella marina]